MRRALTLKALCEEAARYAEMQSGKAETTLYGVTDGKAVGTLVEHRFRGHRQSKYVFNVGSSASGIDLPSLGVDLKVTNIKQPQSSCPFSSARQKVFGLGYALLVLVYDKRDDTRQRAAVLTIRHVIFVEQRRTADCQTTRGLLEILDRDGNQDDVEAFIRERHLPVDEVGARQIAAEVIENRPILGYLTISNALQWRLQYRRIIDQAGEVDGLARLR